MKLIRNNTKTLLESIAIPVFNSKISPSQLKSLPCIIIYNDKFSIENTLPHTLGISGTQNISMNIDVICAYAGEFAGQLDDYVENVITLLGTPIYLADNYDNLESVNVTYQYISEFETPLAVATINIQATRIK